MILVDNQGYLGDLIEGATHYFMISTMDKDGASLDITSGVASVYKDGNTTESIDFEIGMVKVGTKEGLYHIVLSLQYDFFTPGSTYTAVLKGELDSETINVVLGSFSISRRV